MKMKPSKSNKNTLKKSYAENRKSNIFIKSTGPNYFNTIKTTNPDKRKNYLISLLGKKTPKNLNLNKYGLNYKNNNNSHNIKKEIYLTSGYDNYDKKKEDKSRQIPRNINIRLNLNSEIINNNFGNYCFSPKNKNIHKSTSNMNMNEKKIKEKDKLITKLQTELLQLQEFLNQMQKDKQNELYSTYNTMKSIDNADTNYNNSLTAFLNTPSILKFNKNTQKLRNNLNINKNSLYYFHSSFNKAKAGFKQKHNFIRSFSSSSSPRILFPHKLDNIDSYNNNFPIKSLYRKKDKNLRINYNSNPNISWKKNYKFPSPKSYFNRQLSYSNYEYEKKKMNNNKNNKSMSKDNIEFVDKCENLKKRTKILLNRYNLLINEFNNKYIGKKK